VQRGRQHVREHPGSAGTQQRERHQDRSGRHVHRALREGRQRLETGLGRRSAAQQRDEHDVRPDEHGDDELHQGDVAGLGPAHPLAQHVRVPPDVAQHRERPGDQHEATDREAEQCPGRAPAEQHRHRAEPQPDRDLEDRGHGVAREPQLPLQPALCGGDREEHQRRHARGHRDVRRGERRGDPAGEQARDAPAAAETSTANALRAKFGVSSCRDTRGRACEC
jgi:hypothetical protein